MEENNRNETGQDPEGTESKFDFQRAKAFHRHIMSKNQKLNAHKPKMPVKKDVKENMEADQSKEMKYSRGEPVDNYYVRVRGGRRKNDLNERNVTYALEQSLKSELLLTEEPGYMEVEDGETSEVTQVDILDVVDPSSAAKRFELVLKDHGPYRMNYTRNGRYLLLGGERGHVAAIDWVSKKLMCEMNVKDSIYDVAWLHQETLYAVAQKKWLYVYDNKGIEIHCVKQISEVLKLVFLPYHYLLSAVCSNGWLSWLDVTTGTIVEQLHIPLHHNPATVAQHPGNALICIGQPCGIVSFWSPNIKMPVLTKWCHNKPLSALAFDPKGQILATASMDRMVKLWDARSLNDPIKQYKLNSAPNGISFSENGLMALGMGKNIEIYKDNNVGGKMRKRLYLTYEAASPLRNMEFCPCEDVLGIAHSKGFSSILVPGSGQPNFDALEINPFLTKSQRREREIQGVLTKIPYTLIAWDPNELGKVHVRSLEEGIEGKKKTGYIKPPDIIIEPRYKAEQREKSKAMVQTKITTQQFPKSDSAEKAAVENEMEIESETETETETETDTDTDTDAEPRREKKIKPKLKRKGKKKSVLDRFKPKPAK